MAVVVPRVMNIDQASAIIVSISKHRMPKQMDDNRPIGINFSLKIVVRKTKGIAVITIDVLREIGGYRISSRIRKQLETMSTVSNVRLVVGEIFQR